MMIILLDFLVLLGFEPSKTRIYNDSCGFIDADFNQ
jgi:hypothetical protein